MRKPLLIILLSFALSTQAQTKKVLFEEICGGLCGQCPSGAWILDSLSRKYPDIIPVSVHSYGVADAMYFAGIDSIDNLINTQGGAPFGDLDRMKYPVHDSPLYMLFNYIGKFDSIAAVRLAAAPKLTITILPMWDSTVRQITAQVNVHMLNNLTAGDYRISMYVAEDSVIGTGSGYDQENLYNTSPPGNPFYGMGNPIIGYAHRHVLRAALPTPLGQAGVIPSSPTAGQDYSTLFNYTLPVSINENKVSLIAFVYRNWPGGTNNEVFNAEEVSLSLVMTGIHTASNEIKNLIIYPNPAHTKLVVKSSEFMDGITIYDMTGREVFANRLRTTNYELQTAFSPGVYFVKVQSGEKVMTEKLVVE
jgi:hypothetical protein